jgi:hypothetical protein
MTTHGGRATQVAASIASPHAIVTRKRSNRRQATFCMAQFSRRARLAAPMLLQPKALKTRDRDQERLAISIRDISDFVV